MFLLVPAYPGCPGSKAVKRSLLLLYYCIIWNRGVRTRIFWHLIIASASLPSKLQDFPLTFPGPGNFTNTTPGLSRRRGNPGHYNYVYSIPGYMRTVYNDFYRNLQRKIENKISQSPAHAVVNTHTHIRLTRTIRVSRYQKGKTNLDFTEARDSEWQWHQLGHNYASLHLTQAR